MKSRRNQRFDRHQPTALKHRVSRKLQELLRLRSKLSRYLDANVILGDQESAETEEEYYKVREKTDRKIELVIEEFEHVTASKETISAREWKRAELKRNWYILIILNNEMSRLLVILKLQKRLLGLLVQLRR